MTDSIHLSCDNLFFVINNLKSDNTLLYDNKIVKAHENFKQDIKRLEKILFHVRNQALDVEGDHDSQADVQH